MAQSECSASGTEGSAEIQWHSLNLQPQVRKEERSAGTWNTTAQSECSASGKKGKC